MFDKVNADVAFKEDRERFFTEADKFSIPYLADKLTDKQKEELENARTKWRDMTKLKDYPDIDFPLAVPKFINVKLFSSHKKGDNIALNKDVDFD